MIEFPSCWWRWFTFWSTAPIHYPLSHSGHTPIKQQRLSPIRWSRTCFLQHGDTEFPWELHGGVDGTGMGLSLCGITAVQQPGLKNQWMYWSIQQNVESWWIMMKCDEVLPGVQEWLSFDFPKHPAKLYVTQLKIFSRVQLGQMCPNWVRMTTDSHQEMLCSWMTLQKNTFPRK